MFLIFRSDLACRWKGALASLPARIVARICIFKAQWTDGRYLGDVLTRLCPMEVGRIAGEYDYATGWIRSNLIAFEPIAQSDVENARHNCVDSVLRVSMWHQLHARGNLDPDHVGTWL